MPCDALARINATTTKQALIKELFQNPQKAEQILIQLLTQMEGVSRVSTHIYETMLTLALSFHGRPVRVNLTRDGNLSMNASPAITPTLLGRIQTLIEETGGAFFQERVAEALRRAFGSRVEETSTPGRARIITIHR
jgi:hypothetical protein